MAEMDMGLSPNNNNKKKRKKKKQSLGESLRTGLLPCKGDSSSEVARKLIFLGSLCLMIAALVIIAVHFISLLKPEAPIGTSVVDSNGEQVVQDEQQVIVNLQAPTKEQIENLPEGSVNEEYAAYYEANKDFVGWITINGTNVDYPVVQGEDNLFYLHHNFNGEEEFAGTIFTDYEGKFGPNQMPNNTILYGHNMLYKYKFSALNNYNNNIDFLRETPVVDFNTLYQDNKYKIFSVFIDTYNEVTGENATPFTMGGGTYARHFPYAVSFGPEHSDMVLPEFGGPMHGANEAAPIDKLLEALKIYIIALLRLEEIDF